MKTLKFYVNNDCSALAFAALLLDRGCDFTMRNGATTSFVVVDCEESATAVLAQAMKCGLHHEETIMQDGPMTLRVFTEARS